MSLMTKGPVFGPGPFVLGKRRFGLRVEQAALGDAAHPPTDLTDRDVDESLAADGVLDLRAVVRPSDRVDGVLVVRLADPARLLADVLLGRGGGLDAGGAGVAVRVVQIAAVRERP